MPSIKVGDLVCQERGTQLVFKNFLPKPTFICAPIESSLCGCVEVSDDDVFFVLKIHDEESSFPFAALLGCSSHGIVYSRLYNLCSEQYVRQVHCEE